ncbi:trypsin-like serine peptidase [Rhodococcus sp. O3]|uniref:trypsin-like serine peptidase n=1 Tax=Rhodococcus sp. O3 TaxID=3404919 RepID=UPI003B67043D
MTATLPAANNGAVTTSDPSAETSPVSPTIPESDLVQSPPSAGPVGALADLAGSGAEQLAGYSGTPAAPGTDLSELLRMNPPDAAEATWGPAPAGQPALESVIFPDDRVQIGDTTVYPWRVHSYLLIELSNGSFASGTGFFIGPHTVITAGHCVFVRGTGPGSGWVRSVTVMPGRNGSSLPFGSVRVSGSSLRSVQGWTQNGDSNWDIGALILPTNLGDRTGWLGFGAYDDNTLMSSIANIAGYPGDKPTATQWYHSRRLSSVAAQRLFYEVDTFGGQSGSAVYRLLNGQRHAFGIHTNGVSPGVPVNSGVRITGPVFDRLKAWKA